MNFSTEILAYLITFGSQLMLLYLSLCFNGFTKSMQILKELSAKLNLFANVFYAFLRNHHLATFTSEYNANALERGKGNGYRTEYSSRSFGIFVPLALPLSSFTFTYDILNQYIGLYVSSCNQTKLFFHVH